MKTLKNTFSVVKVCTLISACLWMSGCIMFGGDHFLWW
jgi:hypothetical protein